MSDQAKQDRRTVVLQTIHALKEDFPLQRSIEHADAPLRQAYVQTLSYWIHHGLPPRTDSVPEGFLEPLCSIGALAVDEEGISCFPFSARKTEIQLTFAAHAVHAVRAIDALAIPRLAGKEARIVGPCYVCRCRIACSVEASGSVDGGYSEGVRVISTPRTAAGLGRPTRLGETAFVCEHCTLPPEATSFTVPQAAVIGNSFFSFQKRLLGQQQP